MLQRRGRLRFLQVPEQDHRGRPAPWATACGAFGARIDKPGDLEGALRDAFGHPGPALVDVHVNPDEPPMPAKVTYEQAKGFAKASLAGQPRRAAIASTLFRDKLSQL